MEEDVKGLPEFLEKVIKKYPEVWESYQNLGATLSGVDGIDRRTQHLVKLAIAMGAGTEGGVHSHVRRARQAGISEDEIYHAALLTITTIGWPKAVAVLSWVDDVLKRIKAGQ